MTSAIAPDTSDWITQEELRELRLYVESKRGEGSARVDMGTLKKLIAAAAESWKEPEDHARIDELQTLVKESGRHSITFKVSRKDGASIELGGAAIARQDPEDEFDVRDLLDQCIDIREELDADEDEEL